MTTVRLEVDGPVARVVLDRPEVLNAGDAEWVRDLNGVVTELRRRSDLRVVVLTGAGRAFSTGVDLAALASGRFGMEDFVAWEDAMTAIDEMEPVFIAALNGHCLGGGLQLALVCDYRLAREDALIGLARASELILLGEPISARDAERYGLVHRVVAAADFDRAVDETVARFLATPPASLLANKWLARRAFDFGFEEFRREMQVRFARCLDSDDHRRAMAAIRARRRA